MSKKKRKTQTQKPRFDVFTCDHSGMIRVFQWPKTTLYAGAGRTASTARSWDLMISLAGKSYMQDNPITCHDGAASIVPVSIVKVPTSPYMDVDWPDRGTPVLMRSWWVNFYGWLTEPTKAKQEIALFCMGGHGRTGTALSILAGLDGQKDPVAWVRAEYCSKAVETDEQLDYIQDMLGIPIHDEPSDKHKFVHAGRPYGGSTAYQQGKMWDAHQHEWKWPGEQY